MILDRGPEQEYLTGAENILYGEAGSRLPKSDQTELVQPKEWWPDVIDYSTVATRGNICSLDLEGYSGYHSWGVRSQYLPDELMSRMHVDEPPSALLYQLSALKTRAAHADEYPRVTMGDKIGLDAYWLEIKGVVDTWFNAEASLLAFIEQQSMIEGEWIYAPGSGKSLFRKSSSQQFILYVDPKADEHQLLGWIMV